MSYLNHHGARRVPQAEPIPGAGQVPNSAGGHAWAIDHWTRLRRFLILGTERGSYYATERALTRRSAAAVERCIRADGPRAVAEIVRVSDEARAPKNDPALYALAMAAGLGDAETRRAALEALPQVARTGTHLFRFATFVEGFRGWGRSLRRAVGRWYAAQPVEALALQAVKYRQREGVSHRDLLRLAHPARTVSARNPTLAVSDGHERLFDWIVRGGSTDGLPRLVEGFVRAQAAATPAETARLVAEYRLPREAVQPEHLAAPDVWTALLADMPMTALERLGDAERIRRARLHPIAVLAALRTYVSGRGARGRGTWEPVAQVVDALDAAFYAAFASVEPAGGRVMLALDVPGSWGWGEVAGVPGLSPRDASAAMALVTAATEPRYEIVGFCSAGWLLTAGRRLRKSTPDGLAPLTTSSGRRSTSRSARRTARCRCCTRRRSSARSTRSWSTPTRRPGRAASTRPRRSATTAARPASTPGWSSSGWSRTGSRSPTRPTAGCSTSSASTRRRRS